MSRRYTTLAVVLILSIVVTAVVLAGDHASSEQEEMMGLTFWEFDQTPGAGWRAVAHAGKPKEAALLIEMYLERHSDLEQGMSAYLHFHASQLWSECDDEERALDHLSQARVDSFPERFPRSWNFMVKGTRAFIEGDMDLLREARDEMAGMEALSSRDSMFLQGLDYLMTQEGMPYGDIVRSWH